MDPETGERPAPNSARSFDAPTSRRVRLHELTRDPSGEETRYSRPDTNLYPQVLTPQEVLRYMA